MWRSDHVNVIALILSLLLHGIILFASAQVAIHQGYRFGSLPAVPIQTQPMQSRLMVDNPPAPRQEKEQPIEPITVSAPPTPAAPSLALDPPPVKPMEKPVAITPAELMPHDTPPPVMQPDGFGEFTGSSDATALHTLSGDKPMEAHKAEQDQPYISRDPAGHAPLAAKPAKTAPGEIEKPGETKDVGEAVKPIAPKTQTPSAVALAANDPKPAIPQPSPSPADQLTLAAAPKPPDNRFGPMQDSPLDAAKPKAPEPTLIAMAQPPVQAAQSAQQAHAQDSDSEDKARTAGSPDAGTSPSSTADPAPMTDSEMDPFSTSGSVEFRAGKVIAKFGRKVKTVKPRLDLSGSYDLFTSAPAVVLRIRADETGKVRDVKIVKSSGSRDIDQPCVLAVYEWWFEPPRDKNGIPQTAEMDWTITFRSY